MELKHTGMNSFENTFITSNCTNMELKRIAPLI